MSTAGISSIYKMGDPLNLRASGVTISQPDLPHWCVHILHWLAMVGAIEQASGSLAVFKETLKHHMETGAAYGHTNAKTGKTTWLTGPGAVYGIYQSFVAAIARENNKA